MTYGMRELWSCEIVRGMGEGQEVKGRRVRESGKDEGDEWSTPIEATATDLSFRGAPTPIGLILAGGIIGGATWNPFPGNDAKIAMISKKNGGLDRSILFVVLRCRNLLALERDSTSPRGLGSSE